MMYRYPMTRYPMGRPRSRGGMTRAQLEQNYSRPRAEERPLYAFGEADTPYDLNDPEATLEIKRALVALAKYESDPFRSQSDPASAQVWKEIILEGPGADAWDGPTADEFVLAISRYATEPYWQIEGPFFQLGGSSFGRFGIVGGPQPTGPGLEVLAGAVNEKLGGEPAMKKFLAWRGGAFAPPSQTSQPSPTAVVVPNRKHGPFWRLNGYTPVYPEGDPQWVAAAAQIDQHLVDCWQQLGGLPATATEAQRALVLHDCVRQMRSAHDAAAREANKSAPTPPCPTGQIFDREDGRCRDPGVVDLPESTLVVDVPGCVESSVLEEGMARAEAERLCMAGCIQFFENKGRSRAEAEKLCGKPGWRLTAASGAIAIGAALGIGAYFWHRRATRAARPTSNRRR